MFDVKKIWDIPHSDFAECEYRRRLKDEPLSSMGEIHPDLAWFKGHFYLQRAYGMSLWRSGIRAAAVTVAWYAWGKWRR